MKCCCSVCAFSATGGCAQLPFHTHDNTGCHSSENVIAEQHGCCDTLSQAGTSHSSGLCDQLRLGAGRQSDALYCKKSLSWTRRGRTRKKTKQKAIFGLQANDNHPKATSMTTQRLRFCMDIGVTQTYLRAWSFTCSAPVQCTGFTASFLTPLSHILSSNSGERDECMDH